MGSSKQARVRIESLDMIRLISEILANIAEGWCIVKLQIPIDMSATACLPFKTILVVTHWKDLLQYSLEESPESNHKPVDHEGVPLDELGRKACTLVF